MAKNGPIILIDDDRDEWDLLQDVLDQQNIANRLLCFLNGQDAIEYLQTTAEKPFLILSDINMPQLNGIELRRRISEDEMLRKKSIPFVYYTTSATTQAVREAYEMHVQGFFVKGHDMKEIGDLIRVIHTYWDLCRHPND